MTQAASPVRAWIGTIVFLFLAPGGVAGLMPWLISGCRWYDWDGAAWVVVTGVCRLVRNPMYLAVLTIILGQALLFGSWWLVLYAVFVLVAAVVAFAKGCQLSVRHFRQLIKSGEQLSLLVNGVPGLNLHVERASTLQKNASEKVACGLYRNPSRERDRQL